MKLLTREEYYKKRQEQVTDNECALCNSEQILLGATANWKWIASSAPYWQYHTMIMPKRHITEIFEISDLEWHELKQLEKLIVRKYKKLRVKDPVTGVALENVLVFFRQRLNYFNGTSKINNLDHLHLHFTFDREHFLDPISHKNASMWDINVLKNSLDKELSTL